jgi:glycosyltransferase involved in cell wall biosynthesis
MRILYFSRDYTSHDHRFLSAMAKTEHKVYYLRLEAGKHVLEDRPLPPEIEQVTWVGGNRPVTLRDGYALLRDLRRVIRQIKPDLIQAGPLQRSAFLVALTGFHPLVSMSWGYDLLHDAQINPIWRWATRYTLKHSDVMVGDCDTIRHLAVTYGMSNQRIVTFPWGIDLKHFSQKEPDQSDKQTFNLLSTRSWEPIYGIDVIARAFVIAAKQQPELRLTLLGNGSQAAAIRQILLIGGVYHLVEFPGQVKYADLPNYYHEADVYLSASHSDGTSISLLEAMACGTPPIISDIPGNQEWVVPGLNGWLFSDGNATDLANNIMAAMNKRQKLAEFGERVRQQAEERADWERNFTMLEKAYSIALGATSED